MSRIPWPIQGASPTGEEGEEEMELGITEKIESNEDSDDLILANEEISKPISIEELRLEQDKQIATSTMKLWIQEKYTPTPDELLLSPAGVRTLQTLREKLSIENGLLTLREGTHEPRIVLPESLVDTVLSASHSKFPMIHEGYQKLVHRVSPIYYWPYMKRDIRVFVQSCPVCDKFKKSRTFKTELGRIPVAEKGDLLAMVIFGGKESLPVSKKDWKYVLVMIE